jgi:hypothetical protein
MGGQMSQVRKAVLSGQDLTFESQVLAINN